MSTQPGESQAYTIRETAKLTGLAESNLRYYETIGLIPSVKRDASSKYRVYSEEDVNYIVSIACLSATGMSIDDMKEYLSNVDKGEVAANEQIRLLDDQNLRLVEEERNLKLRQKYLKTKAEYWKAVANKDMTLANKISIKAVAIAKEVKLSQSAN
ncbi:MAG: MerR family transcriptional regulator [Patescibacteria group bacterium]